MQVYKKLKFLVGNISKPHNCLKPFDPLIINFLDDFSKILRKKSKNLPDLITLSFFCRKNNIIKLKNKYFDDDHVSFGLGLLFHITPSNIPTNFAYSLIFGLLCGNSNIVKVPTKNFNEIIVICETLNKILSLKKYKKVKQMISIIRYTDNEELTKKLSLICDARLIWGGDKTISNIKKYETGPRNIDIPFSDRFSISLINTEKYLKLSNYSSTILAKNFYNDTYIVDQNACSSPHLILWKGKLSNLAKKKFWANLKKLVDTGYNPPIISSVDNYSRLASDLMSNKNILTHRALNKSLYVVSLKKLLPNTKLKKTKWGFFYECNIKDLNILKNITNKKLQTLTYFGFSKKYLKSFFQSNNFNGIDRVVPFGQALNIDLIWDGYDITKLLTRRIDIK